MTSRLTLLGKRTTTSCCIALFVSVLFSCHPVDVRPGLWLSGEIDRQPVNDWGFTDSIEEIFIETESWYGIRHSTTIWCVSSAGSLYIGSYGDEKKVWEKNIAKQARARLLIDGMLYQVLVIPISEPNLVSSLNVAYNKKYDMQAVFGEEIPLWWFYQVKQHR